jgi:nitrite reductase/ring-hydroxylating ferredoxin subunit
MRPKMNWIRIFEPEILHDADFICSQKVRGKKLCIVKNGPEFFATQLRCPHAGADLSMGWCKNGNLVCSYHRHEFDLKTGKGAAGQGDYIDTYPVEIREDGVYVGLHEGGFLKKLFRF